MDIWLKLDLTFICSTVQCKDIVTKNLFHSGLGWLESSPTKLVSLNYIPRAQYSFKHIIQVPLQP